MLRHIHQGPRGRASWVLIALSPQQYGLYSAFMGCFVYFILGTSRDVTLGPTAIMSLLVSSYTFHEPAYAVLLAFLSGCVQLAMGFLCLGETLGPSRSGGWGGVVLPFLGNQGICVLGGLVLSISSFAFQGPPLRRWGGGTLASSALQTSLSGACGPPVLRPSPTHATSPSPRPHMSSGTGSVLPSGRPGFLLDFISCPVIKGFTSAAAIIIGFGQVKVSSLVGAGVPAR